LTYLLIIYNKRFWFALNW